MEFVADTRRDLQRWLLSGCIVLMAHGGLAAGAMYWHDPDDDDPAAAMVIDLAPMPVSSAESLPLPPGPKQEQTDDSPQQPVEKVEEKPEEVKELKEAQEEQPVLPPAVAPEVAMAALPPEVKRETPKEAEQQVWEPATAPQALAQQAARAVAPTQGQVHVSNSNAVPN